MWIDQAGGPALPWDAVAGAAARMAACARRFVDLLDGERRARACLPYARERHRDWGYVPRVRPGLPLRAMRDREAAACWALLEAGLGPAGAAKTRGVLALEALLQAGTSRKAYRDPLNYALAIFGLPDTGPWAWRFEGHHVSLTFTLVPGMSLAVTPHFFGANPFSAPVVPAAHGGLAGVLEREAALAFGLVGDLAPSLRQRAILAAEAPPDFLTRPGRERSLAVPEGLPLAAMAEPQRHQALVLLEAFFAHLHPDLAGPITRRTRAAGIDGIHFAWAGGTTPDRLHYWRLHGPTVLIEYDRTGPDHAHSVWHDPADPFAEDLLRAHHESAHRHGH